MSLVSYKKVSNNLFLLPNNNVSKSIKYDSCKSSDDNLRANGIDPEKFMAAWNKWKAYIILNELGFTIDVQEGGGLASILATILAGVAVLVYSDIRETKIMNTPISSELFAARDAACKVYGPGNVKGVGALGVFIGVINDPVGTLKTPEVCYAAKSEISKAETARQERAEKYKEKTYKYGALGAVTVGAAVKAFEVYYKKKQKYQKQIKLAKDKITELERKQQEQYDSVKAKLIRISELVKSPLNNAERQKTEIVKAEQEAVRHEENAEKILKEITKLAEHIDKLEAAIVEAEEELEKSQEAAITKGLTAASEGLTEILRDNIEYTRQQAEQAKRLTIIHLNAAMVAKANQNEWLKVTAAAGVAAVGALSGGATLVGALKAAVLPTSTALLSARNVSQRIQQAHAKATHESTLLEPPPSTPLNLPAIFKAAQEGVKPKAPTTNAPANATANAAPTVLHGTTAKRKPGRRTGGTIKHSRGVVPILGGDRVNNRDIANVLALELIASDVRVDIINIIVDKISSIKGTNVLELMNNTNSVEGGKRRNMTRRRNRKN